MRINHPKTGNILLMVKGCDLIAEVEKPAEHDEHRLVMLGHVGYTNSLEIYKEDWVGFMALVQQVDLEFKHDMSFVGGLKP